MLTACKSQAKTGACLQVALRHLRRAALPEDVAQGPRIKIAHALAGGYDSAARYLSSAAREHIIDRDGGRCFRCASPGGRVVSPAPARARDTADLMTL